MSIISTFLTVRGQPSPRVHVGAWLPFRYCEMDYSTAFETFQIFITVEEISIFNAYVYLYFKNKFKT